MTSSSYEEGKSPKNLKNIIMFHAQKGAILNQIAPGANGEEMETDSLDITNLLDEKIREKFTQNTV